MSGGKLRSMLAARFGEDFPAAAALEPDAVAGLELLAGHASVRRFADRPVDDGLLKLLCACALSAPSKSDLQLRDIVVVRDLEQRRALAALAPSAPFLAAAPVMLVFCGNAGRLGACAARHAIPFPNNHADLLVNAVADAAIVLGWFHAAACMAGLRGCAVSVLRDRVDEVAALLDLPRMTLPFAGFALGWPASEARISPRLPLAVTCHDDGFGGPDDPDAIDAYDRRRGLLGSSPGLVWSEAKARQYSLPLRAGLGAFLTKAGFRLR